MIYGSYNYQKDCIISSIYPSAVNGVVLTVLDSLQGRVSITKPESLVRSTVRYGSYIFAYNSLICSMEAIHGRQSLSHNIISGGTLGMLGVSTGRLGIPFVDPMFFMRHPAIPLHFVAFSVYGTMGGLFGVLSGKNFF